MRTNYELNGGARNALKVFEEQKTTVHMTWAFAAWLDVRGADELDRLAYLRELNKVHILAAPGHKELERLEKAAAKAKGTSNER